MIFSDMGREQDKRSAPELASHPAVAIILRGFPLVAPRRANSTGSPRPRRRPPSDSWDFLDQSSASRSQNSGAYAGEWLSTSGSGKTLESKNPATGEVIATVQQATARGVPGLPVEAAHQAFLTLARACQRSAAGRRSSVEWARPSREKKDALGKADHPGDGQDPPGGPGARCRRRSTSPTSPWASRACSTASRCTPSDPGHRHARAMAPAGTRWASSPPSTSRWPSGPGTR